MNKRRGEKTTAPTASAAATATAQAPEDNKNSKPEADGAQASEGAKAVEPVNYPKLFTDRIAAIYGGQRTSIELLYEPLTEMGDDTRPVAIIRDPLAREFFSLAQEIEQQISSLQRPRKPADIKAYTDTARLLQTQQKIAASIAWQHVRGALPPDDRARNLQLHRGWYVSYSLTPEEKRAEAEAEGPFGIPLSMLDLIMSGRGGSPFSGRPGGLYEEIERMMRPGE